MSSVPKNPVPPPAPASVTTLPTGSGPLPRDQVYISDDTRKQLTALGWKEGDPVPSTLGKRMSELRAAQSAAAAETREAIAGSATTEVLKTPKAVDISTLSPEAQDELRSMLAQAKELHAEDMAAAQKKANIEAQIPESSSPEVQQAIRSALEQQAELEADGPVIVMKEAEDTGLDTGGAATSHICPRCYWNLNVEHTAEPTEGDKQRFLVALLGQLRFTKQFSVLGGAMQIEFRSLTADESLAIMRQLSKETASGDIADQVAYLDRMQEYRLALGVAALYKDTGELIAEGVNFDKISEATDRDNPAVVLAHREMVKDVLKQETIRRVVGQHHRQFQRLVETLEARVDDPDFWKGIEPAA